MRILDLGCGNGYVAGRLAALGHRVVGVDSSREGIAMAVAAGADAEFRLGSIYDERLVEATGDGFDCVISLEVIEHLVLPRRLFGQAFLLLRPGGTLIVSTPYHGYAKNLAIALVNRWDRHFSVDWEAGHLRFFSKKTLSRMATASGFVVVGVHGTGRIPLLWKSMVMVARKPEN